MQEQTFTIIQTAGLLNIKVRTVREWIRNGKIKASKDRKGRWSISQQEVSRIQSQKQIKKNRKAIK